MKHMKNKLLFYGIASITAAVVLFCAVAAHSSMCAEPVVLSIPSCGIEVECEFCVSNRNLQKIIDKPGIAAWYDPYIMDHAGQSFNGLWNMNVGEEIVFGTRHYKCSFITTGWSDHGIEAHNRNEKLPDADLYLCTCVPGGGEFEIYIVGINKEK